MELLFVRHGQGEHNLNVPVRLNMDHPRLTATGRRQVERLKEEIAPGPDDLLLVSPTVRTLETANLLTDHLNCPRKYANPLVGPRMFPQHEGFTPVRCDIPLSYDRVGRDFPDFVRLEAEHDALWRDGINTMPEEPFRLLGLGLLAWARKQAAGRVIIVAHDGTITAYREVLGERGLTRRDFLGEAGVYRTVLDA
ncbi:histidine phosphatase family protein [Paenibacillus ginsengihumi]|uniref:histidine phosphatase family protein n=1 Tax=Paenibacillus ginsengihumi TaxID=431596 RepID=UPI000371764C|nr:histidine phosphatase family protein [Paenibacillus ginsengihumi]